MSNLLLYGHTTNVYDALAAGVTGSLSTDWTPSGSNSLLDELKVADIALHDRRILGRSRGRVPALRSDVLLDRTLVDMVTRNPASALRWPTGSIAPGKAADLLVLRRPSDSPTGGMPDSPYRNLIDATERDVRLLLVGGAPVAGDVSVMRELLGRAVQVVHSTAGRYDKAVAYSRAGVSPAAALKLGNAERTLTRALVALGGDGARPASGPPPPTATFGYLQRNWDGGADRSMAPAAFRDQVLAPAFGRLGRRLNIERISLGPLFSDDDGLYFDFLGGERTRAGAPRDPTPPYRLYPANFNQIGPGGDPFSRRAFFDRWYARASQAPSSAPPS